MITLITIALTVLLIVILFVVIASRIRKYKEEKEKYIQYVEEMTRQLNEIQKEEVPSLKRKYLELYKKKFANLRVLCDTYLQFQGRDNAEKMMYSRVVAMVNELKVDMQDHLKLEAMLDEDLNGVMTALRREVKMKEIEEKELEKVKGGGISPWFFAGVSAVLIFAIGVYDGFTRPLACRE